MSRPIDPKDLNSLLYADLDDADEAVLNYTVSPDIIRCRSRKTIIDRGEWLDLYDACMFDQHVETDAENQLDNLVIHLSEVRQNRVLQVSDVKGRAKSAAFGGIKKSHEAMLGVAASVVNGSPKYDDSHASFGSVGHGAVVLDQPILPGGARAPDAFNAKGLYADGLKRAFDIFLVLWILPAALPIVLLLALLIAMDGHSPFSHQRRVGRGGRTFQILKLRTMVPGADHILERYLASNPEARAEWEKTQRLRSDPRITAIGRLLRKTSLDELPQLFNVLKGEMSLVGPRPMTVNQTAIYSGNSYYRMRPGITGLWQVSGRNECSFADRCMFDNAYALNISLRTDLIILLRTLGAVIRCTGG